MMVGDQLFFVILFIGKVVVCMYDLVGGVEGEVVEVGIDGGVVVYLELVLVDFVYWFVVEEVFEIIDVFFIGELGFVGNGG